MIWKIILCSEIIISISHHVGIIPNLYILYYSFKNHEPMISNQGALRNEQMKCLFYLFLYLFSFFLIPRTWIIEIPHWNKKIISSYKYSWGRYLFGQYRGKQDVLHYVGINTWLHLSRRVLLRIKNLNYITKSNKITKGKHIQEHTKLLGSNSP